MVSSPACNLRMQSPYMEKMPSLSKNSLGVLSKENYESRSALYRICLTNDPSVLVYKIFSVGE